MSGRRCNSVEGIPTGTPGTAAGNVAFSRLKSAGALAIQHRDGMFELRPLYACAELLGLYVQQLRLRG